MKGLVCTYREAIDVLADTGNPCGKPATRFYKWTRTEACCARCKDHRGQMWKIKRLQWKAITWREYLVWKVMQS